jgi:hypothetical protein
MPQYQIKSFNSIKSGSLASKCPQRISSLSVLERDVTDSREEDLKRRNWKLRAFGYSFLLKEDISGLIKKRR